MTLKDLLLKILNLVINVDQFKKDLNIKDKEVRERILDLYK